MLDHLLIGFPELGHLEDEGLELLPEGAQREQIPKEDLEKILEAGSFAPNARGGQLPPGQTMEGFFAGESVPVNPKLTEIAMQLHISERTGRGVPTITRRYGTKAFEFRENSIVVTIPFNWINVMGDKVGDKVGDTIDTVGASLKGAARTHARVLAEIRNNPNITIPQIAQELGLSKATVDKSIAALKREGTLERVGSKKTGMWHVMEEGR